MGRILQIKTDLLLIQKDPSCPFNPCSILHPADPLTLPLLVKSPGGVYNKEREIQEFLAEFDPQPTHQRRCERAYGQRQ